MSRDPPREQRTLPPPPPSPDMIFMAGTGGNEQIKMCDTLLLENLVANWRPSALKRFKGTAVF